MGENLYKSYTDKGLISTIHKRMPTTTKGQKIFFEWTKDLSRYFFEDVEIDIKHMKRCSTLLVIREM